MSSTKYDKPEDPLERLKEDRQWSEMSEMREQGLIAVPRKDIKRIANLYLARVRQRRSIT